MRFESLRPTRTRMTVRSVRPVVASSVGVDAGTETRRRDDGGKRLSNETVPVFLVLVPEDDRPVCVRGDKEIGARRCGVGCRGGIERRGRRIDGWRRGEPENRRDGRRGDAAGLVEAGITRSERICTGVRRKSRVSKRLRRRENRPLTHPENIASHKADQHVNLRPRSCMLVRVDTCWEGGKNDPAQRVLRS